MHEVDQNLRLQPLNFSFFKTENKQGFYNEEPTMKNTLEQIHAFDATSQYKFDHHILGRSKIYTKIILEL
jgi:hypothetical protein